MGCSELLVVGRGIFRAATLAGKYAPHAPATFIFASLTSAPFGGFTGGLLVSQLLSEGFACR